MTLSPAEIFGVSDERSEVLFDKVVCLKLSLTET